MKYWPGCISQAWPVKKKSNVDRNSKEKTFMINLPEKGKINIEGSCFFNLRKQIWQVNVNLFVLNKKSL